jgi:hypothetical protein
MAHAHLTQVQVNGLLGVAATVSATAKTITGAVALTGLVKLTATAHGYSTGNVVLNTGIVGTTEGNGLFSITVIDANNFTIPVTFVNAYTSGGTAQLVTSQGTTISGLSTLSGGLTAQLTKRQLYELYDLSQHIPDSGLPISVTLAVAP